MSITRRFLVVFAAALLASAAARAGAPCGSEFIAPDTYKFSAGIEAVTSADVNLDGLPDLIVLPEVSSAPTVRLGEADGGFGSSISGDLLGSSQTLVVDTFTSDPAPDAVVSGGSGTYFFRGNGDGTFQDGVSIVGQSYPFVTSGDVDGDGERDLVAIDGANNDLAVLLGNGDGTFQAPIVTNPGELLGRIAVGDLDGDSLADVAGTQLDADGVVVLLGTGNGQFAEPASYPTGWFAGAIAIVDLVGDGTPDIVSGAEGAVATLIGNGDGTFQAAVLYAIGASPSGLSSGDFDGDGALDPVAVIDVPFDSRTGSAVILHNLGGGVLEPGRAFLIPDRSTPPVVADFGNDGFADVAVGAQDRVSVLRGNGDGTLRALRFTPVGFTQSIAAPGDFDGDARADFAVLQSGELRAFLAVGGGWFSPGPIHAIGDAAAIVSADFNGDGHDDVAIVHSSVAFVTVVLGLGDGSFGPPIPSPLPDSAYEAVLVATDFDGDGILDLVSAQNGPGEPGDLYALRGRGDGSFGDVVETPLTEPWARLVSGDFDEDGLDDIALRDRFDEPTALRLFLSHGGGNYEERVVAEIPCCSSDGLAAADMRQSGHLDLLTGSGTAFTVWPGLGDGSFGTPVTIAAGSAVESIDTADFDGDGHRDVITASQDRTSTLLGLGNGAFQAPKVHVVASTSAVYARDFDGNGRPDGGYTPGYYDSGVTVLLNGELGAVVPNASAVVGTAATLEAHAGGFGVLTYQWRKDGVGLSDGGSISGTTTPTLTIDPVSFDDAGAYDVVVTDACGEVTSNPATLSVEFADVPLSSPFHDDILTIATQGITGGCGGGNYCPTSPVRRDQMAVFLLKSEHGPDYTPPPCTGVFDDVPCPGSFTDWVEQLAAEGVTGGCGVDVYCPSQAVTRAQMAVFLLKTKEGSGYTPPPATGIFGDVPVGSFAADFIEDLYNKAITGGCSASPLLYCPTTSVLRQQMASFLVRAFSIP